MQIANKNDIPQELTVTVEKMSNLGYGIAHVDGFVIFIQNSCPGDVLKIKLTKKNKNYAHAQITEILKPSSHRKSPDCAMYNVCGACNFRHIDYAYQLEIKKEIVKDLMNKLDVEVNSVIPSPNTNEYRRKIQYPISQTKNSKRILAGYYKKSSHELVNIKHCPAQPNECDKIIDYIRNNAPLCNITGYVENTHSGLLRHVLIRSSEYNSKNLVVLVVNSTEVNDNLKKFGEMLYNDFENISGVCVNFNNKKTNLILGTKTILLEGESFVKEKLCDKIFKIEAETFFQVNPSCANKIFDYVKSKIKESVNFPEILDAYAGISAFGICLSDIAKKVVCVEEVEASVNLAGQLVKENNIGNIELNCMDADKFFEKIVNKKIFDVIVLDPPRKGCSKECLDYASALTKNLIVYVSCEPSTLARDLNYLKEKGMYIESIQPFDMFPQTYHIENVAIIRKHM